MSWWRRSLDDQAKETPILTKRPQPKKVVNSTDQLDVTFGVFARPTGKFRVPYMASLLRFQQVAEYLDLVTDDPKYATQDWKVEELFQREVSHRRVLDLVHQYLQSESRPQFFNSLTIVLKPRDLDPPVYQPPASDDAYDHSFSLGPITVSYDVVALDSDAPRPLTHGRLAWNRDEVYAVAIDGQHRLAAIKELSRDAKLTSTVSVLFLVLNERFGFQAPPDWSSTAAMRSIFVDLNKRAEPVSRARNLLLDDIDARAQFVRRLFGPSLSYEATDPERPLGFPIGANGEFDHKIPLVLVDWHGETRSKVEKGPYLSSVLALDWIVAKTLKATHPKKPPIPDLLSMNVDDNEDASRYYDGILKDLQWWQSSWIDGGIREHWQECKDGELPFFLTSAEMETLANEYERTWGRAITRILTTIGPYSDLIRLRMDADTLNPQFAQWYQARSDRDINAKAQVKVRQYYQNRLDHIEEALRPIVGLTEYKNTVTAIDKLKEESLFFFLVGQRALVLALRDLVQSRKAPRWADACGLNIQEYEDDLQDFYAYYLADALNVIWDREPALFSKGYLIKRDPSGITGGLPDVFWAGTLVRRDQRQKIDYSENAAKRGAIWFRVIAHVSWFMRANGLETFADVEPILWALEDESMLDNFQLGTEVLGAIGDLMGTLEGQAYYLSPMSFLAGMLPEPTEAMVQMATKERMKAVLKALVAE